MNGRRPIWKFLGVAVLVWVIVLAAWFGVRYFLPGLEDRLVLAIGVLVGVIATLDRLWKYFKVSQDTTAGTSIEQGQIVTTVGNVGGDVIIAGRDADVKKD